MKRCSVFLKIVSFFLLLLLNVIMPQQIYAQDSTRPKLFLKNQVVDPVENGLNDKILDSDSATKSGNDSSSGSTILKLFSFESASTVEYGYYIVQFSGPVKKDWKSSLSDIGVVFYDYIPQYAFIIKVNSGLVSTIRNKIFVRYIGKYEPELKISGNAYDLSAEKLEDQNYYAKLLITAFPDADLSALKSGVTSIGGLVLSSSSSKWRILLNIKIPVGKIDSLKNISGVKWIEKAPENKISNNISKGIIELSSAQKKNWPISGSPLYGDGQIVAICDTGLDTGDMDTIHLDFSDGAGYSRVLGYEVLTGASSVDYAGHGTHVAGIVAGNGMRSGADPANDDFPSTCFAGAAPKADIYFQASADASGSLVGLSDLNAVFQSAYDAGARISSNSWGSSGCGDYSGESETLDQFVWDNKDFLPVFAGGNAGRDKDMNGVVDLYSLDSPSTAKNCMTVGASESYRMGAREGFAALGWGTLRTYGEPIASDLTSNKPYGLAPFSSRGPTIDGRFKPDIVAPGTNILSTRSSATPSSGWGEYNQYYQWMGGTSMATPLVSGTAAVMREYLIKEEGFTDPSAALVKVSLMNGAVSLVPGQYGTGDTQEVHPAPDFAQGWGRLDFESSINSDNRFKIKYFDVSADAPRDTDYKKTYTFDVGGSQKDFRTTLGWSDYPGSSLASGGLVNDLDLRVKKPDGSWVYPDKARDIGSVIRIIYVDSVTNFYSGNDIGIIIDPSLKTTYPANLESIYLAFKNENSVLSPVSIAVYSYSGGSIGAELFRKDYAFMPNGEFALPIGLTINSGKIFITVEKSSSQIGCYINDSDSGLVFSDESGSGIWNSYARTPAIGAIFRTQVASSGFDRINNVVSVDIPTPESGTYTVEVSAHNIPQGPQPYALVMSGMIDSAPSTGNIEFDPDQPDAPAATFLEKEVYTQQAENINTEYNTSFSEVFSGESSFEVQTDNGSSVSIRYAVTGLHDVSPRQLQLTKLYSNGTSRAFTYAQFKDYSDGNWWLTDVSGQYIAPVAYLNSTKTYYAVSVVKDGGLYDSNPDEGLIDDPQILGVPMTDSSGCTIGTNSDCSILLLMLIAFVSVLLRFKFKSGR